MKNNIIILQGKLILVMYTIAKIIKIHFKSQTTVFDYEKTNLSKIKEWPQVIFVDQTILENDCDEKLYDIKNQFPFAEIVIVALEENSQVNQAIKNYEGVELIDLWNNKNTIIEILTFAISNKYNYQGII